MPFVILPTNSASGGYEITNSLRFNAGSSDYLNRTPSSAGNRRTWTYSCWVKKVKNDSVEPGNYPALLTAGNDGSEFYFLQDTGQLQFYYYTTSYIAQVRTNAYFRDLSAWYHVVLAVDTTQATSTDRIKIYVNGTLQTLTIVNTVPQNTDMDINNNVGHYIGRYSANSSYPPRWGNYYLAETYLIDGQALTPTSFGETDEDTGIWKPKAYTGTYGTNGFYLQFKNSSSLGTDSSGNGNNFTVNNLTSVDQSTDTPTNNFCTLNPLDSVATNAPTFSNGNLTVSTSSTGASPCRSTFCVDKGKWYWEIKKTSASSADTVIGIMEQSEAFNTYIGSTAKGYGYISTANKVNNSSQSSYGATYTNGDIIGVALDMDNGTLVFYKNGTSQGTAYSSLSGLFSPAHSDAGTGTETADCNFGAGTNYSSNGYTDGAGFGNFSYQPPANYFALCTKNLATYG